ncbi:hypothetical protein [Streptomyces sp. NPDC048636]|uniref:hypothetical protein n=1 Tax=Streptomyces sp. NPDC048636 TaxID=3155762 RepID=UPI00341BBF23
MSQHHPVAAEEYRDHRAFVGPDRQLWENNGWSVRGRDDGTDYLLWTSPYLIQGLAGQSYRPGRLALNQTLLITHPAQAPDELVDNDFLAVGWDPDDYRAWDDLDVTIEDDTARWSLGGRTMTAAPPQWRIDGRHAGVETDLALTARSEPQWFTDPQEGLDRRADRWWIANGEVDGVIRTSGGTLTVVGAHGVHERHIHCGLVHDPISLLEGEGIVWFTVTSPELSGYVMARPSRGASWAQFDVDGRTVERAGEGISTATTRTWTDPKTRMVVGQTWHVEVEHDTTRLQLDVQARARAYYSWDFLSQGRTILYWWLCTANVTIEDEQGVRKLAGLPAEAHLNRTYYRRHGAFDG